MTTGPGLYADLPADPLELRSIAVEVAAAAAALVRASRAQGFGIATKSTDTDMVTDVDHASDRLIVEMLAARRPNDAILAEESGPADGVSGVCWVVDPIDGTTNFVYDHPPYTVSIAAVVGDTPIAGVVHDVAPDVSVSAALGHGATRDGATIRVRPAPPLAQALVATGFGYSPERRARQVEVLGALIARIRDVRRMGAASADLCSVASGRVDAYYEAGLGPWDLAAGRVIATEAGARVELLDQAQSPLSIVAAHPDLFGPFMELLVEVGADTI